LAVLQLLDPFISNAKLKEGSHSAFGGKKRGSPLCEIDPCVSKIAPKN